MLAAVGIVFLRVEFEPHARRYVNYIVPSSGDGHTALFGRRPCSTEEPLREKRKAAQRRPFVLSNSWSRSGEGRDWPIAAPKTCVAESREAEQQHGRR